ncbi:MAG: hypothetical protein P4M01_00740 [Acidobacteriota bacterium]|nr:hypothetical protein [Acidobacteriota bacterium]
MKSDLKWMAFATAGVMSGWNVGLKMTEDIVGNLTEDSDCGEDAQRNPKYGTRERVQLPLAWAE